MISVVIPLYNKKRTIAKTIDSILNQTYKDLEIIAVDDGSTDGSADVIANRRPNNIPFKLITQKNAGAPTARNRGEKEAKGEFLFFCDADIVLEPDALKKLKDALDKNLDAAYSYCSHWLGWKKIPAMPYDADVLKKHNYICTMSLIRHADFPGFDEDLKRFQDWDLWLTMAERGKRGIFVPEFLFYARPDRGISRWLPRFFYKLPWLKAVKKYNEAAKIIKDKHKL